MIRRPPRSTQSRSSAASDVYKRQVPLPDEQVKLIMDNDDLPGARLIGLKKFGDTYYSNPGFRQWSASGLAVVWAEENTRDSIFNAFRRKETYATSGNRIKLRFFAGEDLDSSPLSDEGLINKAYSKGVPMGGDLTGLEAVSYTHLTLPTIYSV